MYRTAGCHSAHPSLQIRGHLGLNSICNFAFVLRRSLILNPYYAAEYQWSCALILCSINDAINHICPLVFPWPMENIKTSSSYSIHDWLRDQLTYNRHHTSHKCISIRQLLKPLLSFPFSTSCPRLLQCH